MSERSTTLDNDDDTCRITSLTERVERHGKAISQTKLERSESEVKSAKADPEREKACSELVSLASIQSLLNQPEAAREVLDRALLVADEWLPRDGNITLEILRKLGGVELKLGHKKRAKDLAERLLASTLEKGGDAKLEIAEALELVAFAYHSLRRFGWADVHYRKALMMRQAINNGEDIGMARLLWKLGSLCFDRQDYKQAEELLRKTLGLRETIGLAADAETAKIFQELGATFCATCRYKESEKHLNKALKLFRKCKGIASLDEASVRCDLGNLFSATHRLQKAATSLSAALKIQSAKLGYSDKSVKATLAKLSGVYHAQGKFDKSAELSKLVMETGLRADGS